MNEDEIYRGLIQAGLWAVFAAASVSRAASEEEAPADQIVGSASREADLLLDAFNTRFGAAITAALS